MWKSREIFQEARESATTSNRLLSWRDNQHILIAPLLLFCSIIIEGRDEFAGRSQKGQQYVSRPNVDYAKQRKNRQPATYGLRLAPLSRSSSMK